MLGGALSTQRHRRPSQVGAVVGRSAAGKDFVLQLVCCPDQDGEAPIRVKAGGAAAAPAKKGGGAKAKPAAGGGLELDREWIAEHARQVSRLLPGGAPCLKRACIACCRPPSPHEFCEQRAAS